MGNIKKKNKKKPETLLPTKWEIKLVDWITLCKAAGFSIIKDQLMKNVKVMVETKGLKENLNCKIPLEKWYKLFLGRHPYIILRKSQNLSKNRAIVTEENIRKWFKEIGTYFTERNLKDTLNQPDKVYNCDESAFFLQLNADLVLACTGDQNIHFLTGTNERQALTVLNGANADGKFNLDDYFSICATYTITHNV
ncbi:hypothetical protein PGB90_000881 [Kerria lacca]